jgi:hypothetical protein
MTNLQRSAVLQQIEALLAKPNLSREDSARADALLQLSDRLDPEISMALKRARLGMVELDAGIRTRTQCG